MKTLRLIFFVSLFLPLSAYSQGRVNYSYLLDDPESHNLFLYASPLLFASQLSWEARVLGQYNRIGVFWADYRHAYVTSKQSGDATNPLKPYHFMEFGGMIPVYRITEEAPIEVILNEERKSNTNYLYSFTGFTRLSTRTKTTTSIDVKAHQRLIVGVDCGVFDARLRKYFDDGTDPYKINDRSLYGYTNVDFTAVYAGVAGIMNHNLKVKVDGYGIRRSNEFSMVSFDLIYALKVNADSMTVASTAWGALNGTYHITQATYGDDKQAVLKRMGCRVAARGHFYSILGFAMEFNWYPGVSGKRFSFLLGFGLNIPFDVSPDMPQ